MARARSIVIVAAVALSTSAAGAAASPGDEPAIGRAVFTGAVSPDPSSLLGNPAALDLGREGLHFWFGGTAAVDLYGFTLQHEDGSGALHPGAPVSATTSSYGEQIAIYEVKETFAAGFMLDLAPAEVHPDGVAELRYHTLGGQLQQKTYGAIAGSIRLTEGLFVGGSASYTQTVMDLSFARDTALDAGRAGLAGDCGGTPCGLENPQADEIYRIHAFSSPNGFSRLAFTLGAAWQLNDRVAIGAMYREPPGFDGAIEKQGTVDVTRPPRAGLAGTGGIATIAYIPAQTFEVGARVHVLPELDAVAGARWELTSRTRQFDLRMFGAGLGGVPEWIPRPRGFHDTLSGWGGVEQVDDGQRFVGGARLGLSTGAVDRDRISPMNVEGWSVSADLGAQVRLFAVGGVQVVLVANYDTQLYVPQDVGTSAYDPIARLDCIDSNYDLSTAACQAVRDGYGIDTAAGHYSRWQHVVRVGLRFDVD